MTKFTVGAVVAVSNGIGGEIKRRVVKRVTKTSITLNDGSRWGLGGVSWGYGPEFYAMLTVRLWSKDHEQAFAKQEEAKARRYLSEEIEAALRANPPLDALRRALAVLTEGDKE